MRNSTQDLLDACLASGPGKISWTEREVEIWRHKVWDGNPRHYHILPPLYYVRNLRPVQNHGRLPPPLTKAGAVLSSVEFTQLSCLGGLGQLVAKDDAAESSGHHRQPAFGAGRGLGEIGDGTRASNFHGDSFMLQSTPQFRTSMEML